MARKKTSRSDNVQFAVRLPPALVKKTRQVALDCDSQPCHVVAEALERSLDEIKGSPTIAGRPNKAFVAIN